MEERILDKIAEPFNLKLPEYPSMDAMIGGILGAVRDFSLPSLAVENSPLFRNNWVRMSDKPGKTELILYDFSPGGEGEIKVFIDGRVNPLAYQLQGGKRIIIGQSIMRDSVLYQLAFMDADFLILMRHGNPANIKGDRFLFFCNEPIGTRLTWNEALEKLVDKYRNNEFPWLLVGIILAIIVGLLVYLT